MPSVTNFTLGNFMGGALEERFAGELSRVHWRPWISITDESS